MANKKVPDTIGGIVLHPRARARTNVLLSDLENSGVEGLSAAESQIDRIRLLATALFNRTERAPVTEEDLNEPEQEQPVVPSFGRVGDTQ